MLACLFSLQQIPIEAITSSFIGRTKTESGPNREATFVGAIPMEK